MNFKGKIVVVTGASRGLGEALAATFVKRDATVIVSSRDAGELNRVSEALGATPVVCDVTDEEAVKRLVATVAERFGRLDVMVNNAGVLARRTSVVELDSADLHRMMDVNFFGTVYGSKQALRQMLEQGGGVIVNVVSTSGLAARAGSVGYGATKFAAAGFTRGLALEAEPKGIFVLGVYPGGMKTDLFKAQAVPEPDFATYMAPADVAEKIVAHLEQENPAAELVIRRPTAS